MRHLSSQFLMSIIFVSTLMLPLQSAKSATAALEEELERGGPDLEEAERRPDSDHKGAEAGKSAAAGQDVKHDSGVVQKPVKAPSPPLTPKEEKPKALPMDTLETVAAGAEENQRAEAERQRERQEREEKWRMLGSRTAHMNKGNEYRKKYGLMHFSPEQMKKWENAEHFNRQRWQRFWGGGTMDVPLGALKQLIQENPDIAESLKARAEEYSRNTGTPAPVWD